MLNRSILFPSVLGLIVVFSSPTSVEGQGLLSRLFGKHRHCVRRTTNCQPVNCQPVARCSTTTRPCLHGKPPVDACPDVCNALFTKEALCCLSNHPEGSEAQKWCLRAAQARYHLCTPDPVDPECPDECDNPPEYGCAGLSGVEREYCLSMYESMCEDCQN